MEGFSKCSRRSVCFPKLAGGGRIVPAVTSESSEVVRMTIWKNGVRNLVLISLPLVLWAFLMAVIPVSCHSPWRSEQRWVENGLQRLVSKFKFLALDDLNSANLYADQVMHYYFTNMNCRLLSVETNGANISYTIQHNKLTRLFTRRPVLIHVGLIRTNGVSTLVVDGVSEEVSERLQRLFATRANAVEQLRYPSHNRE